MPSSSLASLKPVTPSDPPALHQHQVVGTPSVLLLSHPPTPGTPPPLAVPVTPRALEELQARQLGAVFNPSHASPLKVHKDSSEDPVASEPSAFVEPTPSTLKEDESSGLANTREEPTSDAVSHSVEDDDKNTKESSAESSEAKPDGEEAQTHQPQPETAEAEREPEQAASTETKDVSSEESVDPFTLMGTDSKVAPGEVDDDATPIGELEQESVTPDATPDSLVSLLYTIHT
jgi:hypothetical protein